MLFNFRRVAPAAVLLVCTAVTVGALAVFVRSTFTGFDLTDEGFYVYAADPVNKANATNGLWGMYIGVVYRAVGYSLVGFRIAGGLLLAGAAGWMGWQAGGLLGVLAQRPLGRVVRIALVVSTVAGAFLYYGLFLLTPSYNWLALSGLMLAVAGVFGVLSGPALLRPRIGHIALVSTGCFLTFWGRNAAGIGFWILAQILVLALAKGTIRSRLSLCAVGVGMLFLLAGAHSVFLLDPVTSLESINRSRSLSLDHGLSIPLSEMIDVAIDDAITVPRQMWITAGKWPLVGLLPLLALLALRSRRTMVATIASGGALLAVGGVLLARGRFDGGSVSYTYVTPAVLALIATAGLAWASSAVVRRASGAVAEGLPRQAAAIVGGLAVVLLGTQALYAFTTNNSLIGQMSGAAVFGLLAAQLLLVAAAGRQHVMPVVLSVALLVPVALGMSQITGREKPYRSAPLDQANTMVTINRHGAQIRLAPAYAGFITDLVEPAKAAGFTPGTPLLDLTPFDPGIAEILGAAAPNTLVFGASSSKTATARWALSQQDPKIWRDAWVLVVNPDRKTMNAAAVTPVVGRSFPSDYVLVATATMPWTGEKHQLWRPVAP